MWRRFPWYVASCEVFYIRGSRCPHPRQVLLHWDIMKPGSELQSPSSARRSHSLVLCAFSHLHHTHTANTNTTTTSLEAISKEVQQLSAGEMGSLVFVRRQVSSKGCVSKIIDWALLRHSTDRNGSSETDNIVVRTAIDGSTSCTSWISDLILDSEIMCQWRKSKRYG